MELDLLLWQLIRSAGILSYVLLSASVVMGVGLKARILEPLLKRPWAYELHSALSAASLLTLVLHVVLVVANPHVNFGLPDVLVPFSSSWRPVAVAMGIGSMYLMGLLALSTRLRPLIGQRAWRAIHYSSFLAWLMALVHGVDAGSDSGLPWVQGLYLGTVALVFFMVVYRILLPAPPREPSVSGRSA